MGLAFALMGLVGFGFAIGEHSLGACSWALFDMVPGRVRKMTEMAARERRVIRDVQQTKQMVPLKSGETNI